MIDSPDSSPEELREFIAAEKACPEPAPDVQARVFARVASTVGFIPRPGDAPAAPGPSTDPAAPTTPSAPAAGHAAAGPGAMARVAGHFSRRSLATFLVGAAVGGATVGTVDHVRSRQTSQASPAVVAAPPVPVGSLPPLAPLREPAIAPPSSESPASAPSSAIRRGAGASLPSAVPRDKRLEAERKLVEMARTALARGQTVGALAALRRHQRSFPGGELAEERDGLWVSALVATGEYAQAREQATRFRRRYPHSLFAPVVEQAIQSIP